MLLLPWGSSVFSYYNTVNCVCRTVCDYDDDDMGKRMSIGPWSEKSYMVIIFCSYYTITATTSDMRFTAQ